MTRPAGTCKVHYEGAGKETYVSVEIDEGGSYIHQQGAWVIPRK